MQHIVNGRIVELPVGPDGSVDFDVLRRAAGIPSDRQLILQSPDGSNRIINPGERRRLAYGECSVDAPAHVRGFDENLDLTAGNDDSATTDMERRPAAITAQSLGKEGKCLNIANLMSTTTRVMSS
jgi:hypothetical protein